MISQRLKNELVCIFGDQVQFDLSLAELSRWKIGGVADVVISPNSIGELIKLRQWIHKYNLSSVVIGATSNLLFSDKGLRAIVIRMGSALSAVTIENNSIIAEAGIWVPWLARKAMLAGLTGIEHTCGIPGFLGGLIYMNGGSQRKNIGKSICYVETLDHVGNRHRYSKKECEFSYRNSIFQDKQEIIIAAGLLLKSENDQQSIRKEMLNILKSRRRKFPNKLPNSGSVFLGNSLMYSNLGPPGKIIEEYGLKGLRRGDAQVSTEHANFIVNLGNARAEDVLYLVRKIKEIIIMRTGYLLETENRFVDDFGRVSLID